MTTSNGQYTYNTSNVLKVQELQAKQNLEVSDFEALARYKTNEQLLKLIDSLKGNK